jgi:DNA-binding PadR family transcriptional regulator
MPRSQYLGELELTILLALDRLDGPAFGMAVYDEIVTATGREMSAPTVYITLARLARKDYVKIVAPSSTSNRATKCFALSASGEAALAQSRRMLGALLKPRRRRA